MSANLVYQIAITKIPMVGPVNAKNLISYCGGVKAVFDAKKKDLKNVPGIGEKTIDCILNQKVLKEAEREAAFIEKYDVEALFYLDKNYPSRLKHYADCPILLYKKGNANLDPLRTVGIIGTRKATAKGLAFCDKLVADLQAYDVSVISGLAYGVDVAAHKKSVELGIETIGVLGHGLEMIYPPQHRSVAQKMMEKGGLLTEYTSKVAPEPQHFPMRNRIVAALCDVLVVVETARKGGSMITAEFAFNYNKDVFAVPGRLNDKYAAGCNHLIKTHKASLIESAEDIAYVMRWEKNNQSKAIQKQLFVELTQKEEAIVTILKNEEDINIDKLGYESKLNPSEMASLLLSLEFKGLIKPLPGKRYALV